MKRKVCVLAIALLRVLSPMGALAAQNLNEGETSLDSLMSANKTGEKVIFSETTTGKNPLLKAAQSAGGGLSGLHGDKIDIIQIISIIKKCIDQVPLISGRQ